VAAGKEQYVGAGASDAAQHAVGPRGDLIRRLSTWAAVAEQLPVRAFHMDLSTAGASVAQELEAKALLLQSRLDYGQATADMDEAIGRTPQLECFAADVIAQPSSEETPLLHSEWLLGPSISPPSMCLRRAHGRGTNSDGVRLKPVSSRTAIA
jgi:hypothetical protein